MRDLASEEIGRAAALIRKRAEAANTDDARTPYDSDHIPPVEPAGWGKLIDNYLGGEVGKHCASWTPAVALAIADWLDIGANPYACVDREPMLSVARAYTRPDLTEVGEWVSAACGCVWRETRPKGTRLDPAAPRACSVHPADHPASVDWSPQGMAMVPVTYHDQDPRVAPPALADPLTHREGDAR